MAHPAHKYKQVYSPLRDDKPSKSERLTYGVASVFIYGVLVLTIGLGVALLYPAT